MTYDVQRYDYDHLAACPSKYQHDEFVLAADAEAHEKAALDGAYNSGYVDGSKDAREGAIRDASQAVKVLHLCNCSALGLKDDLHDEWCIERVTVERLALLTEGSE